MKEDGRCFKTRMCCKAARIFDPFFLEVTSLPALCLLVDLFKYFELELFDSKFLQGLKNELATAKEHAMKSFDWDSVPKCDLYKNRSKGRKLRQERAKVRGDIEDGKDEQSEVLGDGSKIIQFDTWKKDPGERGRRIFYWWRCRIHEAGLGSSDFKHYAMALRFVVLLPFTSCDLN